MSVPNFHRKCNIYVSRLIMCTVFCGNLCALFSNVCGDKNGFVVYNRFTGTERPTYSVSIFMTSKGVAICAFEGCKNLHYSTSPAKWAAPCSSVAAISAARSARIRSSFSRRGRIRDSGGGFFAFLKKRQGMLDGVCITGGEPLVNKNVDDFARRIRHGLSRKA